MIAMLHTRRLCRSFFVLVLALCAHAHRYSVKFDILFWNGKNHAGNHAGGGGNIGPIT